MNVKIVLKPLLLMGDVLMLGGAFLCAYYIRFSFAFFPERPLPPFGLYATFAVLVALIGVSLLQAAGMYQIGNIYFSLNRFFTLLRIITISVIIVVVSSFVQKGIVAEIELEHSRIVIVLSWFLMVMMLTAWRLFIGWGLMLFQNHGVGLTRVAIVGIDEHGLGICQAIQRREVPGYQFSGFLHTDLYNRHSDKVILGGVDDLAQFAASGQVDEVLLTDTTLSRSEVAHLIKVCELTDIKFGLVPGVYEILTHRMAADEIAGLPVFKLERPMRQQFGRFFKRGLDIILSIAAIAFFMPLFFLVALIIKLESQGRVLYRQERIGKGEKPFFMYKFRSMYAGDDQGRGGEGASCDLGVTPFGRFLRRMSIDELLQVINVLKGEMSWVGPRPHVPEEVANYRAEYKSRFDVLPGMTGLTQVSGRKDLTLDEMVRLDLYYIENWSIWLDIQILLRTIPTVLTGRGAY